MKTLTLAFPCKQLIHASFAVTFMNIIEELKKCQNTWEIRMQYLIGKSNIHHARSVMVTEWYEKANDEDGFFFIDSDHTFTAEDILRVVNLEGDLNAGIYCNRNRDPTCFPLHGVFTDQAENIPLKYAATGFLFFRKKALKTIHTWMKETEGLDRVIISDFPDHIESRTIPFFHSIMEPPRASDGKRFWLGEDFSFSYRAIQAGLKLRGCITYTLGHEIPSILFNDKPRRGPIQWQTNVVSIYCGAQLPSQSLLNQCHVLTVKGFPVILYSLLYEESNMMEDMILKKRYEEFHVSDQFSTLVLWGSATLAALDHTHHVPVIYAMLEQFLPNLPSSIQRVKTILFPDETVKSQYTSLMPPERLAVCPLQNLF